MMYETRISTNPPQFPPQGSWLKKFGNSWHGSEHNLLISAYFLSCCSGYWKNILSLSIAGKKKQMEFQT